MSRRKFLQASALLGASVAMGGLGISAVNAQGTDRSGKPLRIIMAGYGPATTSFSLALNQIGDRIEGKYHTASSHFYISRPIFFLRPTFDAWPEELQQEMRAAVTDASAFQCNMKDQEEEDAAEAIRAIGGEIVELTPEEMEAFVSAVRPIYAEARTQYSPEFLELVGLSSQVEWLTARCVSNFNKCCLRI